MLILPPIWNIINWLLNFLIVATFIQNTCRLVRSSFWYTLIVSCERKSALLIIFVENILSWCFCFFFLIFLWKKVVLLFFYNLIIFSCILCFFSFALGILLSKWFILLSRRSILFIIILWGNISTRFMLIVLIYQYYSIPLRIRGRGGRLFTKRILRRRLCWS